MKNEWKWDNNDKKKDKSSKNLGERASDMNIATLSREKKRWVHIVTLFFIIHDEMFVPYYHLYIIIEER